MGVSRKEKLIKSEKKVKSGASLLNIWPKCALFPNRTLLATHACDQSFLTVKQPNTNKWFCNTSKPDSLRLPVLLSLPQAPAIAAIISSSDSPMTVLQWVTYAHMCLYTITAARKSLHTMLAQSCRLSGRRKHPSSHFVPLVQPRNETHLLWLS